MEHMTVAVEWKTASGDPGELEGYFSVFGNVDLGGDVVLPGTFKNTLRYWAKQAQAGQPLPLIADHELSTDGVIGSVADAREDSHGGWLRARFSSDPKAQSIRRKMIEGHIKGMSFTYEVVKHYLGTVAGKSVRFLQEVKMFEATVTPFPMNTLALASAKAVSNTPWSQFTQADYTPAQWARACLIDTGQGAADAKDRYKLPVREPSGALNRNGVHAAAGGHGIGAVTGVPADVKAAAARKLVTLYRSDLGEDPPPSLMRMAGMAMADAAAMLRDAMHKALEIPSRAARKAAADILLDEYLSTADDDQADGAADEPQPAADTAAQDAPGEGGTTGTAEGLTPREYADMIMRRGGAADGSPASLDKLEAEIQAALGRG